MNDMTTDWINVWLCTFSVVTQCNDYILKKPYANKISRPAVLLAHMWDSLGFSRITTASHMHRHLFKQLPETPLR